MTYIVGAYIASPALYGPDLAAEAEFLSHLRANEDIDGIEVPWYGRRHSETAAWLSGAREQGWKLVITGMPGTFRASQENPSFGLASIDETGRRAAVAFAADIAAGIGELQADLGERPVLAVQLHAAPARSRAGSSSAALGTSLAELADLEWFGAEILLEHADAYLPPLVPQKGFLPLAEEVEVVRELSDPRFGISLNWGRSVIETRDADSVISHVYAAQDAKLLRSVTYSGTAASANLVGSAWQDSHLALQRTTSGLFEQPESLLTPAHIAEIRDALTSPQLFTGLKVAWNPADRSPLTRAGVVAENLATVRGILEASGELERPKAGAGVTA